MFTLDASAKTPPPMAALQFDKELLFTVRCPVLVVTAIPPPLSVAFEFATAQRVKFAVPPISMNNEPPLEAL
jgi:hypothetical protein